MIILFLLLEIISYVLFRIDLPGAINKISLFINLLFSVDTSASSLYEELTIINKDNKYVKISYNQETHDEFLIDNTKFKTFNDMLKELEVTSDTKLLDIITAQLIEVGKKIIVDRMKFVNELNHVINNVN
mgnify:CR=1 FL=1